MTGHGWAVLAATTAEAIRTHLDSTSVYLDTRDWWVGYYRDRQGGHYVCPLPCLVIRYRVPGASGVLYASVPTLDQLAAALARLGYRRGVPPGLVNPGATRPGQTDGSSR